MPLLCHTCQDVGHKIKKEAQCHMAVQINWLSQVPRQSFFFFLIGLKAKVAHVYPNNPLKAKGLGTQDYKVA
jgi:hypothetical protein